MDRPLKLIAFLALLSGVAIHLFYGTPLFSPVRSASLILVAILPILSSRIFRSLGEGREARFWLSVTMAFLMIALGEAIHIVFESQQLMPFLLVNDALIFAGELFLAFGVIQHFFCFEECEYRSLNLLLQFFFFVVLVVFLLVRPFVMDLDFQARQKILLVLAGDTAATLSLLFLLWKGSQGGVLGRSLDILASGFILYTVSDVFPLWLTFKAAPLFFTPLAFFLQVVAYLTMAYAEFQYSKIAEGFFPE